MKSFLFILLIFIVKIESDHLGCESNYCLNNSTCIDNGYNKTKCECNLAYNGTRCQYCLCFSNINKSHLEFITCVLLIGLILIMTELTSSITTVFSTI